MSQITDIALEFRNVSKSFGKLSVLKGLDLLFPSGRIYGIIGESGCGKTTALRLMNGLEKPTSGDIFLNGERFDYGMAVSWRRQMGYCLQGYTLFPHMTILENMSIIAQKSGWSTEKIQSRAFEVMDLMGLSAEEYLNKKPHQLSGGQQQRVGIGRAIFMKPQILLMDEPFGALDPITRSEIQDAFLDLQKKLNLTVILVTHDLAEAFKMCHEIVLLEKGVLAQRGKPNRLLMNPDSEYVENFLRTNSPGHLLEEIPLYTAMFSDVYTYCVLKEKIVVCSVDSDEKLEFSSEAELQDHRHISKAIFFEVEESGSLKGFENQTLNDKNSLLDALKFILDVEVDVLPVVNGENKVVGAFGKEALNALS